MVKSVKWNFFKFYFTEMLHRDILKMLPYKNFFDCGLRSRVEFWGRHMMQNFSADRLVPFASPPKKISGVILDVGPFLGSSFWHITRKRLIFEIWFRFWAPIFFNFRWPIHFLEGLKFLLKTFDIIAIQSPRCSEFDAVRRIFVLEKNPLLMLISIFAPW